MIEHILNNYEDFFNSRENLKEILDLERLYRKIVLNRITPSEIGNIYDNIRLIKKIYDRHINDTKLKSYINLDLLPKNCLSLINFIEEIKMLSSKKLFCVFYFL